MNDTLPIARCRHYDVEWITGTQCRCRDCGKQGIWTSQGVSIWVRTDRSGFEPPMEPSELAGVG